MNDTLERVRSDLIPIMGSRRAQMATQTKLAVFDRLSRNALQNVMSFFDYKGTDFMKMRSINKKSKNSYMQELQKRFNADRMFSTLKEGYLEQSRQGLQAFMRASVTLPYKRELKMPADALVHSIPLEETTVRTLNSLLQDTPEFPFHERYYDDLYSLEESERESPSAAIVLHMVTLCKSFKRAFQSKFDHRCQRMKQVLKQFRVSAKEI